MLGQFHNHSTSIFSLALWPLVVLLGCVSASASTVLVIITPEGIVIAADSKIVSKDFGGYSAPPAGPAKKIFLIRNRIAIGTVGINTQTITTADDKPLFSYDPAAWLKSIELEEPQDISVTRLSEIVGSKGRSTFAELYNLIPVGRPPYDNSLCNANGLAYLLAGFESGTATVELVNFSVDQEKLPDGRSRGQASLSR